jgi:uncharacterized protein YkwD
MAVAGLAAGLLPTAAGAAPACAPAVVPADEAALTAMIAAQRRGANAPKVVKDVTLLQAGRRKSLAMARGGAFAHEGSMTWSQGRAGAQNIAMAPTPGVAFRAMLASPPHRRNIMAKEWRFTGVGAARDCSGQVFYTVNFMAPAPS